MNNLKIASFNCKGFKKRNFDYLRYLFDKNDVMFIQESWLYNFELDKVYSILPDSCCLGVSAMDETDVSRSGRPFGGCLIVYKKSLSVPLIRVNTDSNRLCVALIDTEDIKIVFITVYMPCDNGTDASASEFLDVLNEISSILNIYDGFKIIIGGDMNVDFNRLSFNSSLLDNFIDDESLICVDSFLNNNDFTFHSYN